MRRSTQEDEGRCVNFALQLCFALSCFAVSNTAQVYMGIEVDANPGVVQDGQRVDQSGWAAVEVGRAIQFQSLSARSMVVCCLESMWCGAVWCGGSRID